MLRDRGDHCTLFQIKRRNKLCSIVCFGCKLLGISILIFQDYIDILTYYLASHAVVIGASQKRWLNSKGFLGLFDRAVDTSLCNARQHHYLYGNTVWRGKIVKSQSNIKAITL
jgi:hypothetical protein